MPHICDWIYTYQKSSLIQVKLKVSYLKRNIIDKNRQKTRYHQELCQASMCANTRVQTALNKSAAVSLPDLVFPRFSSPHSNVTPHQQPGQRNYPAKQDMIHASNTWPYGRRCTLFLKPMYLCVPIPHLEKQKGHKGCCEVSFIEYLESVLKTRILYGSTEWETHAVSLTSFSITMEFWGRKRNLFQHQSLETE